MRKIDWFIIIYLTIAAFSVPYFVRKKTLEYISSQAAELEHEKIFNARRLRRFKTMQAPETIDLESVARAFHILGIKPSVAAALLYTENGPQDIETGSLDKTDFFTQFPISQRSVLEGSRTLNRMAWDWLAANPREMRAMLKLNAASYTAMGTGQQAAWVENFMLAERKFSVNISWANKGAAEPLNSIVPTPTPDYGNSFHKAIREPKNPHRRKPL